MYQLPFSIDLGTTAIQGLIRLSDTSLVIDWRKYDLFGNPKDELVSLEIFFKKIRELEYKENLFAASLVLEVTDPDVFKTFPMPADSLISLKVPVKRKYRGDAESLSAEVNLRLFDVLTTESPEAIEEGS